MENVEELWAKCLQKYEESKDQNGHVPYGILTWLTNDEYRLLVANNYKPSEKGAYAPSGFYTHEMMKTFQAKKYGLESYSLHKYAVSGKTPRYGFYKILKIDPVTGDLDCFYNCEDSSDFIEESVCINKKNLYTYHSQGPKNLPLNVDDILYIYQPTYLKEYIFQGKPTKTWQITWTFDSNPK